MSGRAPTRISGNEGMSGWQTLRRGVRTSPEIVRGVWITIIAALVGTAGKVVAPIAVQLALDHGINAPGGVDHGYLASMIAMTALAIVVTALANYWMTVRLYRQTERGLATLRVKAFRRVHELPILTQATETRGGLVSRVTNDVDQVSRFLVSGGVTAIVSVGQIAVATCVMLFYSPELTLVVWACFVPILVILPLVQRMLAKSYASARTAIARMTSAIAESVVGIAVVRSHAIEPHISERIDRSIAEFQAVSTRSQTVSVFSFTSGGLAAGVANALIVLVGIWLGTQGRITSGGVLAFVFLVTLFIGPLQNGVRIITELQNALAGWRRTLGLVDTPVDLVDPGDAGVRLPGGPIEVECRGVGFDYGDGRHALSGIDLRIAPGSRAAVVGETGSGKSTFVRLLARLIDPTEGSVRLNGVDLRSVSIAELRSRVLLVPQEGYLFDGTLLENARYGAANASREDVERACDELDLGGWIEDLPSGLDTRVGERGEALSAGERQLVGILRARLADPELLLLDEATSSVDPALEMRLARALERLQQGRTSVTVAHRLATARDADDVIVFDAGRPVQRGTHAELLEEGGVYGRLYKAWSRS